MAYKKERKDEGGREEVSEVNDFEGEVEAM